MRSGVDSVRSIACMWKSSLGIVDLFFFFFFFKKKMGLIDK